MSGYIRWARTKEGRAALARIAKQLNHNELPKDGRSMKQLFADVARDAGVPPTRVATAWYAERKRGPVA